MTFDVLKLLEKEGYIKDGEDNLVHAEKAFFAARVMKWIRGKAQTDPDFNLQAYLVALTYYKLDLADLKFEENELLYRYRGVAMEAAHDEYNEDDAKVTSKFHRPSDTLNSDGTISGSPYSQKPPQGDE